MLVILFLFDPRGFGKLQEASKTPLNKNFDVFDFSGVILGGLGEVVGTFWRDFLGGSWGVLVRCLGGC